MCALILMVLGLVLDCNGFLEGSGVCLDQQGSLNWAAILISVSHFFWNFAILVMECLSVLGRVSYCEGLHTCIWMSINQNKEPWSFAIMFWIMPWTPLKPLAILVKIWIFMPIIGLARIWNVLHGVSKQFNTKYIPPLIFLIFIWILKI